MKTFLLGILTLSCVISMAQAKLGMGKEISFVPGDTVVANTTVTLTCYVKNTGNALFSGTYTLNVALNNGTITPIAFTTNTIVVNSGDSITETATFTAQVGTNGWRVAGNGNTIVVWPISNGFDTTDSTRTILTVIEPQGIHDLEKEIFSMYPNPTTDVLMIKTKREFLFEKYYIYDINAREIMNGFYSIDISVKGLNKGIYWLVLENEGKRYKQKFIKN